MTYRYPSGRAVELSGATPDVSDDDIRRLADLGDGADVVRYSRTMTAVVVTKT